jgi:hypothetical protein
MEGEKNETLTAEELAKLPASDAKTKKPKTEDFKERENERLKARLYQMEQDQKYLQEKLEKALEEQRKPGIQVVEADGEYKKKKRINSSPLSDLMLPPYTKNQVAIYRIIGTEEINPATGLKVDPVDTLIPGKYTILDPFEPDPLKKDKVMANVSGTETYVENGQSKTRQTIDDPVFIRGWLQVPVKDKFGLYIFMERHPMNKSNKFRPNNAPAVFERVDVNQHSPAAQYATMDLSIDAGLAVRQLSKDQVLSYAMTANPPINTAKRRIDEVRGDLTKYAMNNPIPFFKMNKNAQAAVKINVFDALAFGLVDYRPEIRQYVLSETDEEIFTHSVQEEPQEALIKFLAKAENAEKYQAIVDRLNHWEH